VLYFPTFFLGTVKKQKRTKKQKKKKKKETRKKMTLQIQQIIKNTFKRIKTQKNTKTNIY